MQSYGLRASALIQFVMNWAQRMVDPTRAAIIYAGEPVWAGVFGRVAGERLPLLALFGGCLVVLGVLVSELKFKILENQQEKYINPQRIYTN